MKEIHKVALPLIIGTLFLVGILLALGALPPKYPHAIHPRYVRFVEDIAAAKVGEQLSLQMTGDTLDVGYPEDNPHGDAVTLLPN